MEIPRDCCAGTATSGSGRTTAASGLCRRRTFSGWAGMSQRCQIQTFAPFEAPGKRRHCATCCFTLIAAGSLRDAVFADGFTAHLGARRQQWCRQKGSEVHRFILFSAVATSHYHLKIARENARNRNWKLEGYLLHSRRLQEPDGRLEESTEESTVGPYHAGCRTNAAYSNLAMPEKCLDRR